MTLNRRRELLSITLKGGLMAAARRLPAEADVTAMAGSGGNANTSGGNSKGHYKPPSKFGMGGVPLGNEFEVVTDKDACATMEAAWDAGVRYYDVAPWYGLGLAERRYGNFLHNKERSDYVLSTKVGKLLRASKAAKNKECFPFSPSPNDVIYDYTASGVRRSIEDSLQRLGLDSIDIAFVHDISSDNPYLPTPWPEQFEIARQGAFPELTRMREEGLIKGWGIGVNTSEPIMRLLEVADPDVCLLASQYSLIDHKNALNQVFPAARAKNVSFVIGSALNAGFISGSPRYNYGKESYKIPATIIEKRKKLLEVAATHGVDLRTAALQFSAAPDVASALVVGCKSEQQILADYTSMQTKIPAEFWADLKAQNLIEEDAPVPQMAPAGV
jgi:D-threo-aldose 1-dehydrogenase